MGSDMLQGAVHAVSYLGGLGVACRDSHKRLPSEAGD